MKDPREKPEDEAHAVAREGPKGESIIARHPQLPAILVAILGANAAYIILVSAGILILSPEDPAGYPGFWSAAGLAAYLCCGIPLYLGLGIGVGLLMSEYAKRRPQPRRTTLVLSFCISALGGALLAIPIYFVGLMGAAL